MAGFRFFNEVIDMKKFLAMAVIVLSVFILQMPQVQAANEKYVGQYATGYKPS